MIKLIVGLGNPGKEYQKTRHNVGFFIANHLAEEAGVSLGRKKFKGHYGEFFFDAETKVILLEPQTFMNLSGQCVAPWIDFLKIEGKNVLVLHDDLDLPLGRMRGQWAGSSGGHNGLDSIIENLGHPNFCRLRVGIGRPPYKKDVIPYVLSPFSAEEKKVVASEIKRGVEAVNVFLKMGLDSMMQIVNRKL